ncbi:Sec-independent protein translocase protein TatB [Kozakia baliensis]|uniref:Sec-independent protein translocase protein TatB n=1 Tax=Kozakia baliensis TaxID=153496 RepID=UPI000497BA0F|nr:Sec-independent protein translocase protein TatB [Kozakia baliensis]AOX21277.1 hypothetical protein A0U90_07565 [Kozakia baliensis]
MFDFSWSEIALIVVVALVFIGPKDMPVAIRTLSRGIKAVRRMASEFQSHVDDMVREADLGEAREQFRDLKRLDFRDRVTKAIDGDNAIRDSFKFEPPPSLSSPPQSSPVAPSYNEPALEHPSEADLPAPAILPPTTARRLNRERPRWHPPTILPPLRVIHNGKRVAIDPPSEAR